MPKPLRQKKNLIMNQPVGITVLSYNGGFDVEIRLAVFPPEKYRWRHVSVCERSTAKANATMIKQNKLIK